MGYRPDNQALEEPIDKILSGFKAFNSAAEKRIESGEWKADHEKELNEIRKKFMDLQIELEKLKRDTW